MSSSIQHRIFSILHPASCILCVVFILTFAVNAQSSTYYVSPDGDDNNPGTYIAPWATPGYGSKQLQAGDTLIILGGTYILSEFYEDMITPLNSGTQDAWIVIQGEDGNTPVLAGRDDLFSAALLDGVSYIRMENLEITSDNGAWFREGINAGEEEISHIVLRRLHIHHIDEFAIDLKDVEDLIIDECNIHHCGFGAIGGPTGDTGGWRDVLIQKSNLSYGGHYYQGGDGSDRPYERPDGFGIEPSVGPIEIVDCIAEHNRGDGLDSKSENTYIHNCTVANNSCDGIKLWGDGSRVHNCLIYGTGDGVGGATPWAAFVIGTETEGAAFEIINVTIHDTPLTHNYPMYVQYDSSASITLVMRNSIVADGYGLVFVGDSADFIADHNIFHRPGDSEQVQANGRIYTAQQIEAGELGQGNLSRDPLFISPAWGSVGNYHLQQASPAVDAGTGGTGVPVVDLEYTSRPQGTGYDIGAYEYVSGGSGDNIAPAAITDLSASSGATGSSIELEWTAPGDDGDTGTARAYVVRCNTVPITEGNWDESWDMDGEPTPAQAGSSESMTVIVPYPGVIYYLAIKTQDEVPNTSGISNSPYVRSCIQLYAGWNLVAFMASDAMSVADAMSCISGVCVSVWSYDPSIPGWLRYIFGGPDFLNNLDEMCPGYGYWICVTVDCIWDFGAGGAMSPPYLVMQKPPFLLYGRITSDALWDDRSDVSIRVGNMEAGSYVVGSNPRYLDYYVLEVPLNDRFREGDEARIYVDGVETDVVKLGQMGTIKRHDIPYMRVPVATKLFQNYPNPFNPETWISYQLVKDTDVVVRIYAVTGQLVRILDLGHRAAGFYINRKSAAYWDGKNQAGERVTSGPYFYSIEADDFTATRKMVILE